MFQGSIPALITPFKNGEIDFKAFENLIEWQIQNGSHGVVPCGTTGESPTLSHTEHMAIVERCVDVVKGRVPVIAGSGSNSTQEAIKLTQHAKDTGADAALIATPYYNKPTQEGLYEHFLAIHDSVAFPIILYNIPGRSVVDMSDDTISKLAKLPHIVGIKDATNALERVVITRENCGDDFCQLSGCDESVAGFLAQGGHGCISVVANVAPSLSSDLHNSWLQKDWDRFAETRDLLAPLSRDVFCEASPAPVKYAGSVLDLCTDEVRLPLLPATPYARKKIDTALKYAKII